MRGRGPPGRCCSPAIERRFKRQQNYYREQNYSTNLQGHGLLLEIHAGLLDDIRNANNGRRDLLVLVLRVQNLDGEVVGVGIDDKEDEALLEDRIGGEILRERLLHIL